MAGSDCLASEHGKRDIVGEFFSYVKLLMELDDKEWEFYVRFYLKNHTVREISSYFEEDESWGDAMLNRMVRKLRTRSQS